MLESKILGFQARIKSLVDLGNAITSDQVKELDDLLAECKALEVRLAAERYGQTPDSQPSDGGLMKKQLDAVSARMDELMDVIQNSPPIKDAGYYCDVGGRADAHTKSLGDFFLSVRRGDRDRLVRVYNASKDISGETGTTGGYLIPEEFIARLMQFAMPPGSVVGMVSRIQVSTDRGPMPSLDQQTVVTAGQGDTAFVGGVRALWRKPGTAVTETEPTFNEIEFNINSLSGYTEVPLETIADSAIAIEELLTRLFGSAVGAMQEYAILRGIGSNQPLGILNSAAAIAVNPATNNTFSWTDALNMRARFKSAMGARTAWLIHPGIWPDIGVFEVSSGSGGVFMATADMQGRDVATIPIMGWPVLESEHLPQDDNSGAVILADLSTYVMFDREQLSVSYSEHAAFIDNKGTWRFNARMDGKPWMTGAITLADPQGSYTVSPFVYHND